MIYTSYQTNTFKIIKSTFSIYELPHASVIFPINLGIFNCFENSDRAKNFRQTVPIYGWWGGGCPPPPPRPTWISATDSSWTYFEVRAARTASNSHVTVFFSIPFMFWKSGLLQTVIINEAAPINTHVILWIFVLNC